MYCNHCGKEIIDEAVVCPHCGCAVAKKQTELDAPSMGFAVLSFFIPLIGFILWLLWKDKTPLKARSCGKGALIGVIVSVASSVLMLVVSCSLVSAALTATESIAFLL